MNAKAKTGTALRSLASALNGADMRREATALRRGAAIGIARPSKGKAEFSSATRSRAGQGGAIGLAGGCTETQGQSNVRLSQAQQWRRNELKSDGIAERCGAVHRAAAAQQLRGKATPRDAPLWLGCEKQRRARLAAQQGEAMQRLGIERHGNARERHSKATQRMATARTGLRGYVTSRFAKAARSHARRGIALSCKGREPMRYEPPSCALFSIAAAERGVARKRQSYEWLF